MKEWIDSNLHPPRKDVPILIVTLFCDFPYAVAWRKNGTYGEPGFFESSKEYETKESDIIYWMPCPKWPELLP